MERKLARRRLLVSGMGFPNPFVATEVAAALGGRYLVDSEIAVGGQGAVFRATRVARADGSATNDAVALKLHFYPGQDLRVQREITAREDLVHPNLPQLIEHGLCEVAQRRTRYIAWEFIEGDSLNSRLKGGRMLESEVLPIARDVAAAIAAIWSRRIVHGDIKPSNIMLKTSGGAVLIDLGAARYMAQDNSPAARRPFGTSGYLSPEQTRGDRVLSCASDIFSLGIVILQCLQGWHPTNYDQAALVDGIRANSQRLSMSPGLLSMLDKMMMAQPSFRPMPAELSQYFQRLLEKLQEDFARKGRAGEGPSSGSSTR